jgi:hypothetical protein
MAKYRGLFVTQGVFALGGYEEISTKYVDPSDFIGLEGGTRRCLGITT